MARMDHVMQIGKPGRSPAVYMEDYAYTFLKREPNSEKKKYFLYGDREGEGEEEKIYIYGITHTTKEQNTYFKEYQALGLWKIMGKERIMTDQSGKEIPLPGFYIFYAPNQAMQEYLVDTSIQKKEEDILKEKPVKKRQGPPISVKEKFVLMTGKVSKKKAGSILGNLIFYGGCLASLVLLATAVSGGDEYGEISRFKNMVVRTMNEKGIEEEPRDFVVEEKKAAGALSDIPETLQQDTAPEEVAEQTVPVEAVTREIAVAETMSQETISESNSEEATLYVVREGDTLARICKEHYGNIARMQEVCEYNGIMNEDHIAPGQKLYLP